jgi:hypothetical protein
VLLQRLCEKKKEAKINWQKNASVRGRSQGGSVFCFLNFKKRKKKYCLRLLGA